MDAGGSIDRKEEDLYLVRGNSFSAALLVDWNWGTVVEASPILRHMVGQTLESMLQRARTRGWRVTLVPHMGYEGEYERVARMLDIDTWDDAGHNGLFEDRP